jgi:Lon protease-like protein
MMQQLAQIKEHDLPPVLPIFPLTGALLLPRAQLPLNIFEPRYLAMTDDALGHGRFIGMVQPQEAENENILENPPVYDHGCVGRISTFSDSGDGRYIITLMGICRFKILEELDLINGYRTTTVKYHPFVADLIPNNNNLPLREQRLKTIQSYFTLKKIDADWPSIEGSPDEPLINSLSMMCPFAPSEKQALLECSSLQDRSALLLLLMEMVAHQNQEAPSKQAH